MKRAKLKDNLDLKTKVSNRLKKKLMQSKKEKKNTEDKLAKAEALNAEAKIEMISFQEARDSNNSASAEACELAKKIENNNALGNLNCLVYNFCKACITKLQCHKIEEETTTSLGNKRM